MQYFANCKKKIVICSQTMY